MSTGVPLAEAMQYFPHIVFLYDITLVVVLLSIYRVVRSKGSYNPAPDLIVHVLLIIGVMRGLIFQGVLTDITNNGYNQYLNNLFIVLGLHIVLNVVFLFLVYRKWKKANA